MANYIVDGTELTSVANAIRTKGGTNSPLVFPNGFISAVNNISGGGGSSDFSTAEVTVTNNQEENALIIDELVNADVDGLSKGIALEAGESKTISVVLYKDIPTCGYYNGVGIVAVTGDIVYASREIYVSGDGTITVTDGK